MLFLDGRCLLGTIVLVILFLIFLIYSAFFAYRTNAERELDDTEKKNFAPASPYITPATPIIWLIQMIILAPWSIFFGAFLILFPFILIVFRPFPKDTQLQRFILKVGNSVLKINTRLLRILGVYTKPIQFST